MTIFTKLFTTWINPLFTQKAGWAGKTSICTQGKRSSILSSLPIFTKAIAIFALSLACLCSCDASSSHMMNGGQSSGYVKKIKTKYGMHHKENSGDYWLDNPEVTVSTGNFWDRLRSSFQLEHYKENPKVKAQIKWFIRHQTYLNRSVKRASPYMYYIFEQIQKRNLPGELLLLPFIESAFNPFAYSGPGAAGLWQFMSGTGADYGLKQNWWYDGRRDVRASTNAALDYLTYLQSFFDGNWLLAIAAYNTGPGNVQHAVRRNANAGEDTDFFSLGLAQETQSYIPQLLALAEIISHPDEYSIELPAVRDEPYLAEVHVACQIDLAEAAELTGISVDEVRRLNPAYKHKLTDPHSACRLLLPINRIETFKQNLAKLSVVNQTSLQRYKVKRHENIAIIASHFHVSSYQLRRINHLKTNAPRPGKILLIPVESPRITGHVEPERHPESEDVEKATEKSADTTPVKEKPIDDDAATTPQTVIPQADQDSTGTTAIPHHTHRIMHTVKKGETPGAIALRYQISVKELQKWNHLTRKSHLKPGKTLLIIKTNASGEPEAKKHTRNKLTHKITKESTQTSLSQTKRPHLMRISHTVKPGETLSQIAKKYQVSVAQIQGWNHLAKRSAAPGKALLIYSRFFD